jgi:hypothetical protein
MKKSISKIGIMVNAMLAFFVGTIANFAVPEIGIGAVAFGIFAIGTIPQLFAIGNIGGFSLMALQTEIWTADIAEQLFAGNEYMNFAVDHSAYVNNKTVHVPQSGSLVAVEKNRSSLPATIAQRTDTDLNYSLAEFTTDPVLITDLDEMQTSYLKRQSVTGQQFAMLADRVSKEILYNWTPSDTSRVIQTTGATTALLPNSTATGTRKCLTKADIALLATRMDQDNVPANGRFLMLDSIMFGDLFSISEIMSNQFMNGSASQPDGTIATLFGFKIFKRSNVVKFNGSKARVAIGTADATTDCAGSIAWSQYSVAKAIGQTKVFSSENAPEYYGSIFSAMVVAGSKILRTDNAGVWAIEQKS